MTCPNKAVPHPWSSNPDHPTPDPYLWSSHPPPPSPNPCGVAERYSSISSMCRTMPSMLILFCALCYDRHISISIHQPKQISETEIYKHHPPSYWSLSGSIMCCLGSQSQPSRLEINLNRNNAHLVRSLN